MNSPDLFIGPDLRPPVIGGLLGQAVALAKAWILGQSDKPFTLRGGRMFLDSLISLTPVLVTRYLVKYENYL